jgi:hypothetical protein
MLQKIFYLAESSFDARSLIIESTQRIDASLAGGEHLTYSTCFYRCYFGYALLFEQAIQSCAASQDIVKNIDEKDPITNKSDPATRFLGLYILLGTVDEFSL